MTVHLPWNRDLQGPKAAAASPLVYPRADDLDNSLAIINYVTQGLCIVLVSIFVVVRFYARHTVWKSFSVDDCE